MADILLIHGSCHGAWCWRDVLPLLKVQGHTARAIDLPGHGDDTTPISEVTLASYASAIAAACRGETVLVGHSMGGYAITAAAEIAAGRISKLIYVCAYVPAPGATLAQMRRMAPRQPLVPAIRISEDSLSFTIDPDMAPDVFYHDCPQETADYAVRHLCPQAVEPSETCVELTSASRALPRRYIRCLDDRTIPPEFQVTMTDDWPDAHVQDMHCGHSPFFADPVGLAERIDRAIRT
jgi:pimeloyl-ACP methyl ester carboxylesterase